jgi:excisionase family DNA binding protein
MWMEATTATRARSWLTVREIADRAEVSIWTVRRWINLGELRGYRFTDRGRLRVPIEDVEALLERVQEVSECP